MIATGRWTEPGVLEDGEPIGFVLELDRQALVTQTRQGRCIWRLRVKLFALTSMCCFLGEDRWRRRAQPVPAITLQSEYSQSTIRIHSEYIQSTFRVCDLQDFVYIVFQKNNNY